MNWVVTVANPGGEFSYWVEAADTKEAEARGYRLHCSTPNFKGQDRVKEAKAVG